MNYYMLLPNDNLNELTDCNLLGTVSIRNIFWVGMGMDILKSIVKKEPDLVEHIRIINDKKTEFSINQFLDMLTKYQIKYTN